ncbi:MAG: hypothetical protein ACFNZL_07090, partial [Neisseria sp.]
SYAGRLNMTPDEFMGRYGRLNVVGESLTREGVLNQSASAMKDTLANIRRGREAMNKALLDKADVNRAMYRNDLGWIDFVWGSEGTLKENGKTKGAMGLAHIVESRMRKDGMAYDDVARMLTHDITETIARCGKSKIYASAKSETVFVEYNGHRATLTKKQGNNGWLMNAFELHQDDGAAKSNDSAVPTRDPVTRHHGEAGASDAVSAYSTSNNTEALFPTSETEADIADGENHTSDGLLFQDMTAEQAQFAETEAAYGGREAYEAAKAEGRTELDYRQWVQVRTPAFKEWFGDWENDAANASKVVNPKTGEPLVVYHETDNQFTVFDTGRGGHQKNDFETPTGIFTKSSGEKIGLGNIQMPLFANIRNPLAFGDRVEILAFLQRNVPGFSQLHDEFADVDVSFADKLAEAESRDDALLDALLAGVEDTGLRGEILDDFDSRSEASKLLNEWDGYSDNLAQQMKRLFDDYVRQNGYDGMFVERDKGSFGRETDALIALMPNQIKSATANSGAFSADDDSILYQESADLVATHNISEEGILHAAKAGGLPMASLAVAHKDNL